MLAWKHDPCPGFLLALLPSLAQVPFSTSPLVTAMKLAVPLFQGMKMEEEATPPSDSSVLMLPSSDDSVSVLLSHCKEGCVTRAIARQNRLGVTAKKDWEREL